jgi:hypothetical protein
MSKKFSTRGRAAGGLKEDPEEQNEGSKLIKKEEDTESENSQVMDSLEEMREQNNAKFEAMNGRAGTAVAHGEGLAFTTIQIQLRGSFERHTRSKMFGDSQSMGFGLLPFRSWFELCCFMCIHQVDGSITQKN